MRFVPDIDTLFDIEDILHITSYYSLYLYIYTLTIFLHGPGLMKKRGESHLDDLSHGQEPLRESLWKGEGGDVSWSAKASVASSASSEA